MKPLQTLSILVIVFILLSFISLLFPDEGLNINSEVKLKFPKLKEIVSPAEENYKDISQIIDLASLDPIEDTIEFIPDSLITDSITKVERDTTETKIDTIPHKVKYKAIPVRHSIEYADGKKDALHPFFASLKNNSKSELIRVLHYGDSQIEGDRITSYIRNELQKQFGGNGVGLFAPVLVAGTNISLNHDMKGDWARYTIKSVEKDFIGHKRLGVLMSFGRFSPAVDSYVRRNYSGEITLKKSAISYSRARKIQTCKIFFGYNEEPFMAELKYKDEVLDADIVPATWQLSTMTWNIGGQLDQITLSFQGEDSPDIYGMAINAENGISVDNIPLRGSSGTDFTRTDASFFKEMFKELNPKLVIMQFGVNLVPHIIDNYAYYERSFYKQLKFLKSLDKDLSIVVIGVSDMSRKENGRYVSYPNIEKIRDAQKKAAFKAGCAFWDCYEAMGGKNSMPSWVNADPPLARTDFTHFSYKGSIAIAKLFHKALMEEYQNYLKEVNHYGLKVP